MNDTPNDPITASADAISEVAKTGREIVTTGRKFGGWLDKIFGKPIEDTVGLYWSDRVKAKRIERAIYDREKFLELLHKTEQKLSIKGISCTRVITPKIAIGIIENATMEEEDYLHTLWANLLVSGLNPKQNEIEKKYISVLADMTSQDANVFKSISEEWFSKDREKEPLQYHSISYPRLVDGLGKYGESSLITLNRLGLISAGYVDVTSYSPNDSRDYKDSHAFHNITFRAYGDLTTVEMTEFGVSFYDAVIT